MADLALEPRSSGIGFKVTPGGIPVELRGSVNVDPDGRPRVAVNPALDRATGERLERRVKDAFSSMMPLSAPGAPAPARPG